MKFERLSVPNVDQLYIRMHETWWVSHGAAMTFVKNSSLAFTVPTKPLTEATVALVSAGGVHLKDQEPFDMENRLGDPSFRLIPGDAAPEDLRFTHDHYDHTNADRDPDCMFPLEALRALARDGRVGAVAPTHVGFTGWIPKTDVLIKESVPRVAERLRQDGVDVAVLTGG
jgi:D-proline reductase (dithiol) PrdB